MSFYEIVIIGPNWEGKLAIGTEGAAFGSKDEALKKLKEVSERYNDPSTRPDFWNPSLSLEIWTSVQFMDAISSGKYAKFRP